MQRATARPRTARRAGSTAEHDSAPRSVSLGKSRLVHHGSIVTDPPPSLGAFRPTLLCQRAKDRATGQVHCFVLRIQDPESPLRCSLDKEGQHLLDARERKAQRAVALAEVVDERPVRPRAVRVVTDAGMPSREPMMKIGHGGRGGLERPAPGRLQPCILGACQLVSDGNCALVRQRHLTPQDVDGAAHRRNLRFSAGPLELPAVSREAECVLGPTHPSVLLAYS